jgi:hypothetical protein
MKDEIKTVSNSESDTEITKQVYPINAAAYICGLNHCYDEASHEYAHADVEWHDDIEMVRQHRNKASYHDEKIGHHLDKFTHHKNMAEYYNSKLLPSDDIKTDCQNKMDESMGLIREFFSDKTYPWLTDDSLTNENKNDIFTIANKYGIYPDCRDEEVAA